jgi:hypothetical protein
VLAVRPWPILLALLGCGEPHVERPAPPANDGIHGFAAGCYALDATRAGSDNTRWLVADDEGTGFAFAATSIEEGAHFVLRATDLGTYLLYDAERRYLVATETGFGRVETLDSDLLLLDDDFISPAEWQLEVSTADPRRFQLRHRATGQYLGLEGLAAEPAVVALYPTSGCAEFPEMSLDAEGTPTRTTWEDGALYGFVETHTHLFTNFGFGGGGIFHGSPFHRLGVEHALPSCEPFHGKDGRRDIVGYLFSGLEDLDPDVILPVFLTAMVPDFYHHTDGWPTFTDWPSSWGSGTHQTQYYRWLERAWLSGMRLLVQHATTNSVLCEMIVGLHAQRVRYSCNDMVAVEREIAETYALERYIDAQAGGPGEGWFRVVKSPAEARQVIAQGKLAVILGIEVSNLFDCFLTPPPGQPACDEAHVIAELDRFHTLGVRAMFPVHKFDNGFSAGDGDRNVGQVGSFINSGHYSNFVSDCPDVPSVFDHGRVIFGGLNRPRDEYLSPAPNDLSGFAAQPVRAVSPFLPTLLDPPLEGDYCQKTGLTPLGETLLEEMMRRGMIVEVDHLPRRAFLRAYELLTANDYPPVASHGNSNRGEVYRLGGVSKLHLNRCGVPGRPGAMGDSLRFHLAEIEANGAYLAEGLGFDLNGFAGGPKPRFGPDQDCGDVPQANPVTWPFTSFDGAVTFTQPHMGTRTLDFNTTGMIHIGLLPELIEDVRKDGVTDEELMPLFKSAEGYLRMWERAEMRGAEIDQRTSKRSPRP